MILVVGAVLGALAMFIEPHSGSSQVKQGEPLKREAGGAPDKPSTVFWDDFETGINPDWVMQGNNFSMVNGELHSRGWLTAQIGNTSLDNYAVEFDLKQLGANLRVLVRRQDDMNYMGWQLVQGCCDCAFNWMIVKEGKEQEVPNSRTAAECTAVHYRIETDGNMYKVFQNGIRKINFTNNIFSNGSVGLIAYESTNFIIDNFKVETFRDSRRDSQKEQTVQQTVDKSVPASSKELKAETSPHSQQAVDEPAPASSAPASSKELQKSEPNPLHCEPQKVCRDPITLLPARILTRSFSNVYKDKDKGEDSKNILAENIRTFSPLYIFERQIANFSDPTNPEGWYQVGETPAGVPLGWMRAKDVIEWHSALTVFFTHPGVGADERKPVLFFDDADLLHKVAESTSRESEVKALYGQLDTALSGESAVPDSIVSMEPKRWVDVRRKENFYLLPVTQFQELNIFDDPARYLRVVAAVPNQRASAKAPDLLDNPEFRNSVAAGPLLDQRENLGIDIVFVMDMTASMQPFIDKVKEAMTDMVRVITRDKAQEKVRFGLVGYRDDIRKTPALEFTARNFTPDLVSADDLVKLLGTVQAARVGSEDYAEEVYAGVAEAADKIKWGDQVLRFIIFIGDASAHEPGHPQSTTNLNADAVRQRLTDKQINLIALHLKETRANQDHAIADQQFGKLATNPGVEHLPSLISINTDDQNAYLESVKTITSNFVSILQYLSKGNVAQLEKQADTAAQSTLTSADPATTAEQVSTTLGYAALVPWLGKGAQPPRDITAWVIDRDLEKPQIPSLDVRVMVTKEQVNNLIFAVEKVVQGIKRARLTQMQFFDALQGIATTTAKGEEIIYENATDLKASGLLESWITSLPYKSDVQSMNNDYFASLSPDEKAGIERNLEAKLANYREISSSDRWVALNANDASTDNVYLLELVALP